jgi:uncharacterized membrane protein YraQ (UPF0718 family)
MLQTIGLYAVTIVLIIVSLIKNKQKTLKAIKKAWKALENILPQFLGVIVLVGLILAVLNPEAISGIIGSSSGWLGAALASVIGAITLIPGIIAFPTAALLIEGGAGYMQIGAFVSSLMMVGVVTIPVEIKYFGKKTTLIRNSLALVFSFFVAFILGKVMGEI